MESFQSKLLNEFGDVDRYLTSVLRPGSTCQFPDIKADAPCKGQISLNQCSDKNETGDCGFCYGDSGDRNLIRPHSWFFRMVTDIYSKNEPDARCPSEGIMWGWNDYRPVLGENSWANLIGPLQVAFIKYGAINRIPQTALELAFAMDFLPSLQKMFIPKVHAFYYAPHNTYSSDGLLEYSVSTENNISLLSGLKMLLKILQELNIYPTEQSQITLMINEILTYLKNAFRPEYGYFSQGGIYTNQNGSWTWAIEPFFAVDCQTWTISVIGAKTIDSWFGAGTTVKLWETTKKIAGYHYNENTKQVDGIGFSYDKDDEVFSGEWTFGAINALRVAANYYEGSTAQNLLNDADIMRKAIERELTIQGSINGHNCPGVLYTNKRYWIPFGWWANPVISTASTGWAIAIDKNFNPMYLGGSYNVD